MADADVTVKDMPASKKSLPLKGKTFVFTGSLDKYSRSEAKKLVEDLGARAASSVSSNTDYVVAGEDPGRKYDDAQSEHVEILDEAHFERLLNERKK